MALQDSQQETERKSLNEQLWKQWIQGRVAAIHQRVSAYEVLVRHGVKLRTGGDREEQFSCPFHGQDRKPSARVYPAGARSPSHAWCFVCQERWDSIAIWSKFNGGEDKPFSRVLMEMEQVYGLETPKPPKDLTFANPEANKDLDDFDALYDACQNRLKYDGPAYRAYKAIDDMNGFLVGGSVLDKVKSQVDDCKLSPASAMKILRQLLDRIGEKTRACPEG
jgi:hypothetical protein